MAPNQTSARGDSGAWNTDSVPGGHTTARSIAQALGGTRSGDGFLCRCPVPMHGKGRGDRTPALSVSDGDKGLLVHCFAKCNPLDVLASLRARGLLDGPHSNGSTKPNGAKAAKPKPVHTFTYEYRDPASGDARYSKIRHEYSDGSKDFYIKPNHRGGSPPLLYGGERLADLPEGQPVWIVEGEKKVDALRERYGAIAVSGDTGAGSKWGPEHALLLRGLPIIFWPDNDSPGEQYTLRAAAVIRAEDPHADLRFVRPFPMAAKGEKSRDACDWSGSADDFAKLVESAKPYYEPEAVGEPFGAGSLPWRASLDKASTIEALPIRWVWRDWLARGKVHILAGAPGVGKSTQAITFAAIVSSGGTWPDGTRADVANVIIWSGEDDAADTLIPRLRAAGADLDHIYFASMTNGAERCPFDPSQDVQALQAAIEAAGGAGIIIIDPIVSAVAADSHKNSETRRGLQPLVDLAAAVDAALLGVTHFTKGSESRAPIDRVTGSLAFGALARVVMVAAREPDSEDGKPGKRILARAKSNIGPDDGGFTYSLELTTLYDTPDITACIVKWNGSIKGNAREILANIEGEKDESAGIERREAEDFLLDLLMDGQKSAKECKAAAAAAGITLITLKRAKAKVRIASFKDGMTGGWVWKLPEGAHQPPKGFEAAHPQSVSPFGDSEPLHGESGTIDDWLEGEL
jgi:putative DNA primase/helicase